MNNQNHENNNNNYPNMKIKKNKENSIKYIDANSDEPNGYDDDDNDSLGSALSDYNTIFYDAPTITGDQNNSNKNIKEGSTDISFNEKTDEDSFSIEDEEFGYNNTKKENVNTSLSENEETINLNQNDLDIDKEFEDYLNDDDSTEFTDEYSPNEQQDKKLKRSKLENFEFCFENYEQIRQMAIEKYGFVNKKFRQKAWPVLILYKYKNRGSLDDLLNSSLTNFHNIPQNEIQNNKYFNQVTLDVVRTLKRFPPEISDKLRLKLQNQLIDLICKILIKHENLHYYQGYHDICLTFLLVTGANDCLPLLEYITLSHLTCYMETTMESTLKLLFNIMPLIDKVNPKVAEHIQKAELGVIFGLSWLITWYSHVMDNLKIILRLYDFFIASDPLMPIYLGAIIVADNASDILSTDCDMASLHTVITKYPTKINDNELIENYIVSSLKLFEAYPPKSLPLLNENWLEKCKTLQEEEALREKLEREENLKRRKTNSNNNNNNKDGGSNKNNQVAKKKNRLMPFKNSNTKLRANKFFFGLTFTVGVAAVAMYAMNTNVVKDTPDLFSKFYQFLSLKEF